LRAAVLLVIPSMNKHWELVFYPEDFQHGEISPSDSLQLARGLNCLPSIIVALYLTEMMVSQRGPSNTASSLNSGAVFLQHNKNMNVPLLCHHWTTMLLFVWAYAGLNDIGNHPRSIPPFFLMTLYSSTEQGVFISMLLYRFNSRGFPRTVYFLAVFYVLTRIAISVGTILAWWAAKDSVFQEDNLHATAISIWLFFPIGNFVLNWTQYQSAVSQFGIAANMLKKQKIWRDDTQRGHLLMQVVFLFLIAFLLILPLLFRCLIASAKAAVVPLWKKSRRFS